MFCCQHFKGSAEPPLIDFLNHQVSSSSCLVRRRLVPCAELRESVSVLQDLKAFVSSTPFKHGALEMYGNVDLVSAALASPPEAAASCVSRF